MSSFARSFPVGSITEEVIESNPWFADLMRYWRPAGDALRRDLAADHALLSQGEMAEEDPKRLRLAIRDGYVNFYRGGQSVARSSAWAAADCMRASTTNISMGKRAAARTISL